MYETNHRKQFMEGKMFISFGTNNNTRYQLLYLLVKVSNTTHATPICPKHYSSNKTLVHNQIKPQYLIDGNLTICKES